MSIFRTISAIALAVLVLVSSTSFMVGMHICMGEVQNIALFTKADGCAKEQQLPPCHRHTQAPCCDDESIVHDGDDFNTSSSHITADVSASIDVDQPYVFISEVIPSFSLRPARYVSYDPPLRSCDLTVEHQVFLI